jgi:ubiquinone/menaquinone biosynthesis C-methylase UbiE
LIGVDVTEAYSNYNQPPNVIYDLGNILHGLEFTDGYFDYIFQRFMNSGIPSVVWPKVVRELGRLLKRGGTIEFTEYLMTMDPPGGPNAERVRSYLYDFYSDNGIDALAGLRLEAIIKEELRWTDVYTRIIKIPMGDWAGVSGQLMKKNLQGAIEYTMPESLRTPNTLSKDLENWEELSQRDAIVEEFWREVEEYNMSLQVAIVVAKRPD